MAVELSGFRRVRLTHRTEGRKLEKQINLLVGLITSVFTQGGRVFQEAAKLMAREAVV
jgi:hypothetical protein